MPVFFKFTSGFSYRSCGYISRFFVLYKILCCFSGLEFILLFTSTFYHLFNFIDDPISCIMAMKIFHISSTPLSRNLSDHFMSFNAFLNLIIICFVITLSCFNHFIHNRFSYELTFSHLVITSRKVFFNC